MKRRGMTWAARHALVRWRKCFPLDCRDEMEGIARRAATLYAMEIGEGPARLTVQSIVNGQIIALRIAGAQIDHMLATLGASDAG